MCLTFQFQCFIKHNAHTHDLTLIELDPFQGQTPIDVAAENKHNNIVKRLRTQRLELGFGKRHCLQNYTDKVKNLFQFN